VLQYAERLKDHGIDLDVSPAINSKAFKTLYSHTSMVKRASTVASAILKRTLGIIGLRKYDLLFLQREALFFGPPLFEKAYMWFGKLPMVLDLDDATYLKYDSPTFGKIGSKLKFFGKTDDLIDRAEIVICGNPNIAEYVCSRGAKSIVLPTTVDGRIFCPVKSNNSKPVIGWIGTHSTYPFLENIFRVFERLAQNYDFKLLIVGSGETAPAISGIEVESRPWTLETEVSDFQAIDIGLYPMFVSNSASVEWLNGKSGFKAIQYMAVGKPFVMSPVGVASSIGIPDKTHFNADNVDDWYVKLESLLKDRDLSEKMGSAGRNYFLEHFDLTKQARYLAGILKDTARSRD